MTNFSDKEDDVYSFQRRKVILMSIIMNSSRKATTLGSLLFSVETRFVLLKYSRQRKMLQRCFKDDSKNIIQSYPMWFEVIHRIKLVCLRRIRLLK